MIRNNLPIAPCAPGVASPCMLPAGQPEARGPRPTRSHRMRLGPPAAGADLARSGALAERAAAGTPRAARHRVLCREAPGRRAAPRSSCSSTRRTPSPEFRLSAGSAAARGVHPAPPAHPQPTSPRSTRCIAPAAWCRSIRSGLARARQPRDHLCAGRGRASGEVSAWRWGSTMSRPSPTPQHGSQPVGAGGRAAGRPSRASARRWCATWPSTTRRAAGPGWMCRCCTTTSRRSRCTRSSASSAFRCLRSSAATRSTSHCSRPGEADAKLNPTPGSSSTKRAGAASMPRCSMPRTATSA
jgi:hypothetical protein